MDISSSFKKIKTIKNKMLKGQMQTEMDGLKYREGCIDGVAHGRV
jgi:hypothetical protein